MDFINKTVCNKIVRFFLVSGLNTVFGYGLFALLVLIGLHYTIAGLVATVLGVLFNFKSIGLLVFKTNRNVVVFKFIGVYGINYVISILLLTVLEQSGIDAFLGKELFQITNLLIITAPRANACIGGAILIVPMGLLAYALNHRFVFGVVETAGSQKLK
jgi:putative flippase GtrA